MNKEELRKEATTTVEWKCTPMTDRPTFINGYITSAEPREKRIADLEQKLEQAEKDLADYQFNYPTIKELQKENAELTCQMKRNTYCYSCTNATEKCYKKEIGCPCGNYKTYKDENAELKKRNGELAGQKASLERWLGEANAIIKKFSEFLNSDVEYDPEHPQEHTDLWNELCEQAERFLKEFTPPKS